MNNRGNIIISLLMLVMAILVLMAMVPAFQAALNIGRSSDHLNCPGYTDSTTPSLSYNASLSTETISCTAMDLTLPLIVLVVIIGGIMAVLYGKSEVFTDGGTV